MKLLLIIATTLFALVAGCGSGETASPATATAIPTTVTPIPSLPDPKVPSPDFTLPSAAGGVVKLSDYLGKQPVVVVFYRGFF